MARADEREPDGGVPGAFVTLAQIAGVAGLAWALFRTAFGGSWKDNGK